MGNRRRLLQLIITIMVVVLTAFSSISAISLLNKSNEIEREYNNLNNKYNTLKTGYESLLMEQTIVSKPPQGEVKKIVYMIGDGMGENNIACTKNYLEENQVLNMEKLSYSGSVDTKSLSTIATWGNDYPTTPDSAAGGTALATGTRVYNDYVSMTSSGEKLETIAEIAKAQGLAVGIVTTDYLFEATPAAFYAHTTNRNNHVDIRKDLYSCDFDLVLGKDFYSNSLLIEDDDYYSHVKEPVEGVEYMQGYIHQLEKSKITDAGYKFFDNFNYDDVLLDNPIQYNKLFGAFPSISMSYLRAPQKNSKVNNSPSLSQLTSFAIEWMELHFGDTGYFLMIENNDIDEKSEQHNSSAIRYDTGDMVECVLEFDRCVGMVKNALDKTKEPYSIVVSADHGAGRLIESTNREDNYGFWSTWHDNSNVPYYIEAYNCNLEKQIDNTELFYFIKNLLV